MEVQRSVTVALIAGLLVGALGGYVLGRRQARAWGIELLRQETTGMLSLHVEALAQLRLGESERGLAALEASVNRAVTTIAADRPVTALDAAPRDALALARAYRSRFPARGPLAGDVGTVLAQVADIAVPSTPAAELLRAP